MEIVVERYISNNDTTLSRIAIDGEFCCYGLEDAYHPTKIKGHTRIPAGRYAVVTRKEGRHHELYSRIFADIHRGALHIKDVPGFQWIMIHVGNTNEDTEGCLLVGMEAIVEGNRLRIARSREAYRLFYQRVVDAAENGTLWITFEDKDR